MSDINLGGSSSLPTQRVSNRNRTEAWKKATMDYYINFKYSKGSNLRSEKNNKIINYNLANGIVDINDVHKICDPLGTGSATFSDQFMHHDIISPIIHELLGEEMTKPDNSLVYSESTSDITRKQSNLKAKIMAALQQSLMGEIDPSTIDPENPPPTPEAILKAERMNPSDIIESKANKTLKVLKKKLNTKWHLSQGFKDVLIAGEEVYWTGILNGEPAIRKCNPLNTTIILDDDSIFIDDAIAVIEERQLTLASILDEYGDELSLTDLKKLEDYSKGAYGMYGTNGDFHEFTLSEGFNSLKATSNISNNFALTVTRVEWIGMKQVGALSYTDIETGEYVEKLVDEEFFSLFNDFKSFYPDAELEKMWVNDAWEGLRIGVDIYIGVKSKPNQRRRMDNPYYTQLGYTGLIYEATNSKSISIVDRLKSYQYLRDIIAYKLQLVFASDIGKVLLMDMAQIPRSEGIDVAQWMYYLKEMKIAFINSFEESTKGVSQGKLASERFNQFTSIDLSLSNSVQQYMNYLSFIDQQVYAVSGVSQQRLAKISRDEAVGNVQQSISQSETNTQYLFEGHQEVRRRVYTALIEVAKIAWRDGLVTQYVNDDLALEILQLEESEFENSEFAVFVSDMKKDRDVKAKLDQLAQVAMEQQKADLSTIIDTVLNDSPKDIINVLKKAEADFYTRQQEQAKSEQEAAAAQKQAELEHAEKMMAFSAEEKQKDRDLQIYISDAANETKIHTAQISAFSFNEDKDMDTDGTPDILEIGAQALEQQALNSKHFNEQQKLLNDKTKHDKEITLKEKELKIKQEIEAKKLETVRVQNKNQIDLANKKAKLDEKMANKKIELEKIKIKAAAAKAKQKPKKK